MSRNPTILAAFALVLAGGSACRAQDAATVVGEAVCGPRCVEFVLAWYGRPHMTLSKETKRPTTPAMAAGLETQPWTLRELVERATLG